MKNLNLFIKALTLVILFTAFNPSRSSALNDALKVKITGNSYSDETVIRFLNGATPAFDGNWDAYKFISPNPNVPSLYTMLDSVDLLSINAYPELNREYAFDLYTLIPAAGTYTIQGIELGAFAASTCILLEDLQTGTSYNLRDPQAYSFTMSVMTANSPTRFRVHFSVPAVITTTPASPNMSNGSVTINKPGDEDFIVFVQDSAGNMLMALTNIFETGTITGLPAGGYFLMEANNECGLIYSFVIGVTNELMPDSMLADTITILISEFVDENNSSLKTASVNESHPVIISSDGTITVILHGTQAGGVNVKVFDLLGAETGMEENVSGGSLRFSPASSGIYIVMITEEGKTTSTKVYVTK